MRYSKPEIEMMIDQLRGELPFLLEVAKLKTKYQKVRLDAFLDEGFSRKEAMEIIKHEITPFDVKDAKGDGK